MIIRHNSTSAKINNTLQKKNASLTKNIEKLSSGLRINGASDDAAGLAISEKMRAQIRGLNQASRNIQDGISFIQTAEGGMHEIHSMLQRMNELAVQAANGTNNQNDRSAIQQEVAQLKNEINRIARNTKFNGIKLLSKPLPEDKVYSGNYVATWVFSALPNELDRIGISDTTLMVHAMFEFAYPGNMTDTWVDTPIMSDIHSTLTALKSTFDALQAESIGHPSEQQAVKNTRMFIEGNMVIVVADKPIHASTSSGIAGELLTGSPAVLTIPGEDKSIENTIFLQIGSNTGNTLGLELSNVTTAAMGIADLDVTTAANATSAIGLLQNATSMISSERSRFGAYQNRLEHAMNHIGNYAENLSASESRIRDVDMAKEMMALTVNKILTQAGQSMLMQSKAMPEAILQLLN